MRKIMGAVLVLGLLAGCGDDDDGGGEQVEATTTTAAEAAPARATEIFVIPFSVDLPEDWTLTERDDRLVQLWPGEHEEVAPYEISIGADYDGTVAEALDQYRSIEGATITEHGPIELDGYAGEQLDVAIVEQTNMPDGYRLPAGGLLRVIVVDVDGRLVHVNVDPITELGPDDVEAHLAAMLDVLETIDFEPA